MVFTSSRRVKIGLPVYNGARYLAETLDSWLRQDYADFEMVVSDNASTNETPANLADYQRRDSRIRVIRRESTVAAAESFNGLVHEASTLSSAWSAYGDMRAPSFLRKLVAVVRLVQCSASYNRSKGTLRRVRERLEVHFRGGPDPVRGPTKGRLIQ